MQPIRLKIADNRFAAFITIISEPDYFPDFDEVLSFLHKNDIKFGIIEEKIRQITTDKVPVTSALVAKGQTPKGRLDWHISIDNPNRPTINEQDRADFKKLLLYNYISKDEKIVSLLSDSVVEPGNDIYGNLVEATPEELQLPGYKGLKLSSDKKTLIADDDGYLVWEDNILSIDSVFHVKGDVDYSTGNLKLKGPVIIDGDIRSGFRVETNASIFVGGTVDAASLYAQNGDITIKNGILGQGRAKILCGGNLQCGFAQDANIAVQNDIIFQSYALNCNISAGGLIRFENDDSVIRGGTITAEKGIIAKNVGSERGTFTELKIRNYSEGESHSHLWKISRERADIAIRVSSLKKRQDFLNVLKRNVEKFSDSKEKELNFVSKEIERLDLKLKQLISDELLLQKEASKEIVKKEVLIHGILYHNVRIEISKREYYCDAAQKNIRVYKLNDEIVLESLNQTKKPEEDFIS